MKKPSLIPWWLQSYLSNAEAVSKWKRLLPSVSGSRGHSPLCSLASFTASQQKPRCPVPIGCSPCLALAFILLAFHSWVSWNLCEWQPHVFSRLLTFLLPLPQSSPRWTCCCWDTSVAACSPTLWRPALAACLSLCVWWFCVCAHSGP